MARWIILYMAGPTYKLVQSSFYFQSVTPRAHTKLCNTVKTAGTVRQIEVSMCMYETCKQNRKLTASFLSKEGKAPSKIGLHCNGGSPVKLYCKLKLLIWL